MGGKFFSKGPDALYTPRMPPAVYQHVRALCHGLLSKIFVYVVTPVEGPGKADFGDVDFLVAEIRPGVSHDELVTVWDQIMGDLNAKAFGHISADFKTFAITWLDDYGLSLDEQNEESLEGSSDTTSCNSDHNGHHQDRDEPRERYIEVDIRMCSSQAELEWVNFKNAHGDLWSILGSIIQPLGLTADDIGLQLRIPDIEQRDKKRARVLLTTDRHATLEFLGMSETTHDVLHQPFASREALFGYAASCRFFHVKSQAQVDEEARQRGESQISPSDGSSVEPAPITENIAMSAGHRHRLQQRSVFKDWIESFIPHCRATNRFPSSNPPISPETSRETVRLEALRFFGPAAQHTYDARLLAWTIEQQERQIRDVVIKESIPTVEELEGEYGKAAPMFRGVLVRELKKIVLQGDFSGLESIPDRPFREADGRYLLDDIADWVRENWRMVGQRPFEESRSKYEAEKRAKAYAK